MNIQGKTYDKYYDFVEQTYFAYFNLKLRSRSTFGDLKMVNSLFVNKREDTENTLVSLVYGTTGNIESPEN